MVPYDTAQALEDYHVTAVAWDAAQRDADRANPLFDHLRDLFRQLRDSEPGRQGIAALMNDPNVGVRLIAASDSLGWAEAEATEVLTLIENRPGLHAVTAKIRLSSPFGGDSSVRERDLDAGAAEVDHCDQRVGGVESVSAV